MSKEATAALSSAQERIRKDYKDMGSDSIELGERIVRSFQQAFDKPPLEEFELILQKTMTPDEVRVALFSPRDDQVKYYPILLLAGTSLEIQKLGDTHPLARLKALVLSTVFLLHRHSWKNFLEEFVIRGGLHTLANMLAEPNLYFRGQVVEIFLTITDCDIWDWFQPRTDVLGRTLHIRFLELSDNENFLDNLLVNRRQSFPGGSMRCMQILAFWLSWVRAMYTKNQILHLSNKLLAELQLWAEYGPGEHSDIITAKNSRNIGALPKAQADGSIDISGVSDSTAVLEMDPDMAPVGEGEDEEKAISIQEEKKLAATLVKDFGQDQYKRDDLDIDCEANPNASLPLPPGGKVGDGSDSRSGHLLTENTSEGMTVSGIDRPIVDASVEAKVTEAFARIGDKIEFKNTKNDEFATTTILSQAQVQAKEVSKELNIKATSGVALKEQGNMAFGRGDYLDASELYSKALICIAQGNSGLSDSSTTTISGVDANADESNVHNTLLSSLHFNCAACHWKIYQKKTGTYDNDKAKGNDKGKDKENEYMDYALLQGTATVSVAETLELCAIHCRSALQYTPSHYKAGYRLGAVLLAQNKSGEALHIVDQALSLLTIAAAASSNSVSVTSSALDKSVDTTYSSLKELRIRCIASTMLSATTTSTSSNMISQITTTSGVDATGRSSSSSQGKAISSRVAGVLAALQKRKQRENARETHALAETWVASEEEECIDNTFASSSSLPSSMSAGGVHQSGGDKNNGKEKDITTPLIAKEKTKKHIREGEDEDVSAYFGSSNVYTGTGGSSDTKKSSKKSSSNSSSSGSGFVTNTDATDAILVATTNKQLDADAKKAARVTEKKATRKILSDSLSIIKSCANAAEKSQYSTDVMDTQRINIVKALQCIWAVPDGKKSNGKFHTLNSAYVAVSITLEEHVVIVLVHLMHHCLYDQPVGSDYYNIGMQCAVEFSTLDRASSILSMARYGNTALQSACSIAAEHLRGKGLGDAVENAATFLQP